MTKVINTKTQGNAKRKAYIKDLIKNKKFIEGIHFVNKSKNENLKFKRARKLAYKFKVDLNVVMGLTYVFKKQKSSKHIFETILNDLDMCDWSDDYDSFYNKSFPIYPLDIKHLNTKLYYSVYPLRISIHKDATKRDVLDFINKKWHWIEQNLTTYRRDQKFRKRKFKNRDDNVWSLRVDQKKSVNDVVKLINKKYSSPDFQIEYNDVYKIISLEKTRRSDI